MNGFYFLQIQFQNLSIVHACSLSYRHGLLTHFNGAEPLLMPVPACAFPIIKSKLHIIAQCINIFI